MSRPCSVCSEAHHSDIDAAITAGQSLREVARTFGIPRATLTRHAAHLVPGHPGDSGPRGPNREAAERTIGALRSVGRLELVDSARVATFQTLADAVDTDPTNAALWREYRAAETSLREVTEDGTDELTEILSRLSAPVGGDEDKEP